MRAVPRKSVRVPRFIFITAETAEKCLQWKVNLGEMLAGEKLTTEVGENMLKNVRGFSGLFCYLHAFPWARAHFRGQKALWTLSSIAPWL